MDEAYAVQEAFHALMVATHGAVAGYKIALTTPVMQHMVGFHEPVFGAILAKTIQGLPTGFRTVFVLRDVEGLSTEETAETLGLSVPAVKSRLLRARLQLRERLSRYFKKKRNGGDQQQ